MAGKGYIHSGNSQMASTGTTLNSMYHTKQLNAWPNSSASDVVKYNWLSAYPGEIEPFKNHTITCGHLISFRNKPQQKQPRKLSAPLPV